MSGSVVDLRRGNCFIFLPQPDTVAQKLRTFLAVESRRTPMKPDFSGER